MKLSRILTISLASLLMTSTLLTGCAGGNNDSEDSEVSLEEDRLPIVFNPSDFDTAVTNKEAVVLNFMYSLSRGDYETALKFCDVGTDVVFDATALQKAALKQGIGRGDSITFYGIDFDEETAEVDFDLTVGGRSSSYDADVCVLTKDDGTYAVDLAAQGYVEKGNLRFRVPRYVDVYINGTLVPKELMGNDFIYDITEGIPKAEEGAMSLTIKTNLGIEQTYPIYFVGTAAEGQERKSGSISLECYSNSLEMTDFSIGIPREVKESAEKYISETVIPTLYDDIIHGRDWDSALIRNEMHEDSNQAAMKPLYYKQAKSFSDAVAAEGGNYYFYDLNVYNYDSSDKVAERMDTENCVTDYNIMRLCTAFDYDYLYTRGSAATERNYVSSGRGDFYLSKDSSGNWYIYDLGESCFKLGLD